MGVSSVHLQAPTQSLCLDGCLRWCVAGGVYLDLGHNMVLAARLTGTNRYVALRHVAGKSSLCLCTNSIYDFLMVHTENEHTNLSLGLEGHAAKLQKG